MILCKEEYAKKIDKSIFPGIQGGPLMHVIAAKAVAFGEALQDDFKGYAGEIIANAKHLAEGLQKEGLDLVSGGTDNHLLLVDLRSLSLTGKIAEKVLDEVDITVNKNVEKIFAAKGRPSDNPLIIHIAEEEQLNAFVEEIPEKAAQLMKQFWPGPLTLIFKKKEGALSDHATAGLSTVAVRMPDHPVALAIISASGLPIAAPSANRSGRPILMCWTGQKK